MPDLDPDTGETEAPIEPPTTQVEPATGGNGVAPAIESDDLQPAFD